MMVLAKAPMRVSFFGGGTDIPAHYLVHGGATISSAIDKFVYVAVGYTPHEHIKVSYMKQELVTDVDDIKNDIVREALKLFGIRSNVEINTWADIPTVGTGLAGSSAFTCALVRALAAFDGHENLTDYQVADIACTIEIEKCGWNIGKQDQYASAFGGLNFIEYTTEDNILVTRLIDDNIASHCILIPTNLTRHSSAILNTIDFDKKSEVFNALAGVAHKLKYEIPEVKLYSQAINESWNLKKQMASEISNTSINKLIERCLDNGALACKLLGAGGGGYLLTMCEDEYVKRQLFYEFSDRVCLEMKTVNDGASVVYKN